MKFNKIKKIKLTVGQKKDSKKENDSWDTIGRAIIITGFVVLLIILGIIGYVVYKKEISNKNHVKNNRIVNESFFTSFTQKVDLATSTVHAKWGKDAELTKISETFCFNKNSVVFDAESSTQQCKFYLFTFTRPNISGYYYIYTPTGNNTIISSQGFEPSDNIINPSKSSTITLPVTVMLSFNDALNTAFKKDNGIFFKNFEKELKNKNIHKAFATVTLESYPSKTLSYKVVIDTSDTQVKKETGFVTYVNVLTGNVTKYIRVGY